MVKNKNNTVKKNKELLKEKDKLRRESRQKAQNNKDPVDPELLIVNMKFPSFARRLKHKKNSLPRDRIQKKNSWKRLI